MKRKPFDEAYKLLFGSPRIACQLLHSFVDIPLVKKIRPEDLLLIDKSFISRHLKKREADLLYQVKNQEQEAYIYILMEFQSSPDKAIPVRMLNYITMFYDTLLKKSKAGKLPPVLPLLIYNGTKEWNVPFRLEELIEPYLPQRYIPRFEYYPIIEKNYSDETLFEINNLASAIMIMENTRDEEILQDNVDRVVECLKKEHQEDIDMFLDWYYQMRDVEGTEGIKLSIKEGDGIMLAEVAQKLNRKLLNEGMEQGKLQEKQDILIKLLDLKYGTLDEDKHLIENTEDLQKLDSALEAIVLDKNKETILGLLK